MFSVVNCQVAFVVQMSRSINSFVQRNQYAHATLALAGATWPIAASMASFSFATMRIYCSKHAIMNQSNLARANFYLFIFFYFYFTTNQLFTA